MTLVKAEFLPFGVWRGNELFLSPAAAVRFVRRCRELQLRILGAEGFVLSETYIQPRLDQILDLSSSTDAGWDDAESFLTQRLYSDLMFVIVVSR